MENGADSEVVFRDEEPEKEESAPPTPITTCDMDVIIRGWEEKFMRLTKCLREVQLASERASSDMCLVSQEARAQGQDQERRLGTMQEGLTDFLQRFETTRAPTTPHVDALTASTPHGIPPRIRPEFGYQPSPVGRHEVLHPEHNTLPHTRSARTEDQADSMETHMGSARSTLPHIRSARTGDQDDVRETRNTLPHASSARTGEHIIFRDTRTRDQDDAFRDTRTRDQDDVRDTRAREHSDDRNARNNIESTNDPHTRTTEGTAETYNKVPTTLAITHRFHARHQALRFRHLMEQIQPSSVPGLFNLRPSRPIRAGQQGNG